MSDISAIRVENLQVHFGGGSGGRVLRAVDGLNLAVAKGSFHGVVGESGCGKTTLARTIVGLQRETSGKVWIDGRDRTEWVRADMRSFSKHVQFIFQDPLGSLSRRQTVRQSLEEPLLIHGYGSGSKRKSRIDELLDLVALPSVVLDRMPRSLSGGQRQRVSIARALALEPSILVCDEPLSALDVSVRAQIVNLFKSLQSTLGLTVVMVAHDLAVIREVCSSVTVMYLGRVAEEGATKPLFREPNHPYTQALLSAVPSPSPVVERSRERILLQGDPPSPSNPPPGCRFQTRCPIAAPLCRESSPELRDVGHGGAAACHFANLTKRPEVSGSGEVVAFPKARKH